MKFMAEIEKGGIPVDPAARLRAMEPRRRSATSICIVPATVVDLTAKRHAAARDKYAAEAEAWREAYAARARLDRPAQALTIVRALLQRTTGARVRVADEVVGEIGAGLVVLLGVGPDDDEAIADGLARRVTELRIFDDAEGRTNLSLIDVGGAALVVCQFTLYADTRRGRRPGFTGAARPGARGAPLPPVRGRAPGARRRGGDRPVRGGDGGRAGQ